MRTRGTGVRARLGAIAAIVTLVGGPALTLTAAAGTVTVSITDRLSPASLDITVGTIVTWHNGDSERHRVRSTSGPTGFDSGNLEAGQSFSYTFNTAGTYNYHDERNDSDSSYFGTVVVRSLPSSTTTTTTTTTTAPTTTPTTAPTTTTTAPPAIPPPGSSGSMVDIVDRAYRPSLVTVPAGTRVSWGNIDDRPHTVTARNGSFDSGIFDTGGSYARTFNTAGTFEYWCVLHPDMVGTVVVTGGSGTTTTSTTTTVPTNTSVPPPPPGDVRIVDNAFSPVSISVPVGSALVWSNAGALPHTVTGQGFDSGIMMPGTTYRRTFNTAGTYPYLCSLHPEMTGTIRVGDSTNTGTGSGEGNDPSTDPAPPPASRPAPAGDIRVVDNSFSPSAKTINAGTTLVWSNAGALPHTVTGQGFDSGIMMPGTTYRRTFNTAGTYPYLCTLHGGMTGTIIVTGTSGSGSQTGAGDPEGLGVEGEFDESVLPEGTSLEEAQAATSAAGQAVAAILDITVFDNGYDPVDVTAPVGATLTWTNVGQLPHTVTDVEGSFDSGFMSTGDSYSLSFDETGTYEYLCTIHPEMVGTITIVEAVPAPDEDPGVAMGGVAAGGADWTGDPPPAAGGTQLMSSGTSGSAGPGSPSLGVAIVLASGLLAGAVALAGGMVAFGRFASNEAGIEG